MKTVYNPEDHTIEMVFRMQIYVLTPHTLRSNYVDFHIPEHIEMARESVIVVSDNHQGILDTIQTLRIAFNKAQDALLDEFDVASFEP